MVAIGEFDIMDWIKTGTVAQRSVPIYNDLEVVAEFEELERRLAAAERAPATGEESVGERSDAAGILERMQALHDRWESSKATWVVRALSDDEIRDIDATLPAPTRPEPVTDDADDTAKAAHADAVRAWAEAQQVARNERNLAYISKAIVRVETTRGTATRVPVEALRAMRREPHGAYRTEQLLQAVTSATTGDVEVPAPKSPAPSRTARA